MCIFFFFTWSSSSLSYSNSTGSKSLLTARVGRNRQPLTIRLCLQYFLLSQAIGHKNNIIEYEYRTYMKGENMQTSEADKMSDETESWLVLKFLLGASCVFGNLTRKTSIYFVVYCSLFNATAWLVRQQAVVTCVLTTAISPSDVKFRTTRFKDYNPQW